MKHFEDFSEFGLSYSTLNALKAKGFEKPTRIQELTIPELLKNESDIIGRAQTGTGKTAAFGIPIIERLNENHGNVQTLILTPTRELAIQVAAEIDSLKGEKRLKIMAVYGGQSIENQIMKLKKGVDIVAGTPGRVLDHLNRKTLNLKKISYLVLDEADEMLNMGFIDDVIEIMQHTGADKRTLLFSATMPSQIVSIAKRYMKGYMTLSVENKCKTTVLTDQAYVEVSAEDKFEVLSRIIDVADDFYGLIFCKTKVDVDVILNRLLERGFSSSALHGDISQHQRERILKKFKTRAANILVATDVAARGLDINNLSHVINYSLPQDPDVYVHRIGRTGRAGKVGTAITLVTRDEYRRFAYIKRAAKAYVRKMKIPEISEVIDSKRDRFKARIMEIIDDESDAAYTEMARDLLSKGQGPEKILSALLRYSLKDELDVKGYHKIMPVSFSNKGKSRLFVAKGKNDGMSPQKLADFIKQEINQHIRVNDLTILDKFSFITTTYEEAQLILYHFKKKYKGRRPIVELAKGHQGGNENLGRIRRRSSSAAPCFS